MIELTFLQELILIKQMHQKSVLYLTMDISQIKALTFNEMLATDAMTY